jgi:predicted methyltransferase
MRSVVRAVLLVIAAAQLGSCASMPQNAPAASAKIQVPRDSVTAAAIESVLAGPQRSPENRARDVYRHPLETLLFFGIKPGMTVVETWPGPSGWYTEVLAPLLAEHGKLIAAQPPAAPGNEFATASLQAYAKKLASMPATYGKVELSTLRAGQSDIAPPDSVDLVVTILNLHNWMSLGMAPDAFSAMFRTLKSGGTLGVVEHRGNPARPQDSHAASGYVDEDYAIAVITAAGFELVARSEVNANPLDTKDYQQGVWTLPPDYRLGNRDRAKYEAIGESDRFTLKFRKP